MIARITKFYMIAIVIWVLLSLFSSGVKALGETTKSQIVIMANSNLNIAWQLSDFLRNNDSAPLDKMMREIEGDIRREIKK